RLRWIALTSAGYTRYDTPQFRAAVAAKKIIVTNASSVYSEPCAQHALAMMLALARRIPHARDNQLTDHAWPYLPLRAQSFLLSGQLVLLVGYGSIPFRPTTRSGSRPTASSPPTPPADTRPSFNATSSSFWPTSGASWSEKSCSTRSCDCA